MIIEKPKSWSDLEFIRNFLYLRISVECNCMDDVLEIGCGNGMGLQQKGPPLIAKKVKSYLGVDKAKWENPPFDFIHDDIFDAELGKYDIVIALYVIQYVDKDRLFELVSRALKPTGIAFFSEGKAWNDTEAALECLKKHFNNIRISKVKDGMIVSVKEEGEGIFCMVSNDAALVLQ